VQINSYRRLARIYACVQSNTQGPAESADVLWLKLTDARRQHFIVCVRFGADDAALGVYAEHAYTILDLLVEGDTRIVQIRNPWSRVSDREPCDSHGVLWMPLPQFCKAFVRADVCCIRPSWCVVRLTGVFSALKWWEGVDVVELDVSVATHTTMCVYFRYTQRHLFDACLLVVDSVGNVIASMRSNNVDPCLSVDVHLQAGRYSVIPLSYMAPRGTYNCVVVHSAAQLAARRTPMIWARVCRAIVRQICNDGIVSDHDGLRIYRDGMYYAVVNRRTSYADVRLECTRVDGLRCTRDGVPSIVSVVPPNCQQFFCAFLHVASDYVLHSTLGFHKYEPCPKAPPPDYRNTVHFIHTIDAPCTN